MVLSQRRDLLEQSLDFLIQNDVLHAAQPIVSKHYRKTQWLSRLLFHRHGISAPWLTNGVKVLKEGKRDCRLKEKRDNDINCEAYAETTVPYPVRRHQTLAGRH